MATVRRTVMGTKAGTKAIVVVALAGFAALASPASADTTLKSDDSSVEIIVPNGWRQTKPASPKVQIQATNGRAIVVVRVTAKEDYKDLKSFASVASSRFMKRLVDAEPKTEEIQINGNPRSVFRRRAPRTTGCGGDAS